MPATITSPEQQHVLDLLNLRPAAEQQNPFEVQSLAPITEAMMRGLTNLKSNKMAQDAASEAVDTPPVSTSITSRVDPGTGKTVHDVTHRNVVVGNAQDAAQAAYDIPQHELAQQLAPYMSGVDKPMSGPEVAAKLNGFRGRYELSRKLGNSPIAALVDAGVITQLPAAREGLGKAIQNREEEAVIERQKEALPLLQEADRQKRLNNAQSQLNRQLGKENADVISKVPFYSTDPDKDFETGAAAIGKTPDELTPREKAGITNAATISRTTFEKSRANTAANVINTTSLADVGAITSPKDLADFVNARAAGVPGGMSAQEKDVLARKAQSLATQWNEARGKAKRDEIRQNITIALDAQRLQFGQDMAKLNTPEAVDRSVKAVLADGNQLYSLPDKTPVQQAFKAKVEAGVQAQTGGRLPQQIKAGSDDDKRLTTVAQGRADIQAIGSLYDKWANVLPLGGVFLSRLNEKEIQNSPTTSLVRLARQAVPGFDKLTPQQQAEYVTDASTLYHRSKALTGREVRAIVGGRVPEQLFNVYASTTPGMQPPEVFRGLIRGAQQEFDNAETAVRNKQWGGAPPNAKAAAPAESVILQHNSKTGEYRYSTDGGKTWQPGRP